MDWRTSTASNQPQRRLRPVTVPNSWPRSPSRWPTASSSSVGKGPGADAGRIGLDDAEHEARGRGAEAGAGGRRARDRVRRGDERIGAVIDVEQHALRAFEQDAAAARPRLVERLPHRPREGKHGIRRSRRGRASSALAVDRRLAEAGAQRIVMRAEAVELRAELAEMGEVADADRAAADLVLIGRADAAPRRADLARARGILAQRVEVAVEGQDQRAGVGDLERLRRDRDALLAEPSDLVPAAPRDRARRRCRSPRACRARCPRAAGTTCRSGCRRPACGRHCARPGSGRRRRRGWPASRRSCPCPRRPTGRRSR